VNLTVGSSSIKPRRKREPSDQVRVPLPNPRLGPISTYSSTDVLAAGRSVARPGVALVEKGIARRRCWGGGRRGLRRHLRFIGLRARTSFRSRESKVGAEAEQRCFPAQRPMRDGGHRTPDHRPLLCSRPVVSCRPSWETVFQSEKSYWPVKIKDLFLFVLYLEQTLMFMIEKERKKFYDGLDSISLLGLYYATYATSCSDHIALCIIIR